MSLIALLLSAVVGSAWYRWRYPYGYSHCCLSAFALALNAYADDNGGWFPAGGESPEASLCLLWQCRAKVHPGPYLGEPDVFRGMTVPYETVNTILRGGRPLGPDTCGWHYVEGLSRADGPDIGILWCKTALDHNGKRTDDGGRQVLLTSDASEWVPGDKWEAYVRRQNDLRRERRSDTTAP